MTTPAPPTATLADFLLARIAEDEAQNGCNGDGEYTTCWRRSERIEKESAAKRRIVGLHAAHPERQRMVYGTITACSECGSVDDSPAEWPCPTIRVLAAVYADHPDYREEWKP